MPDPAWPDRMGATDALFWLLDTVPELRSTIGALIVLERPPALERVREEFDRVSRLHPRLRQVVVEVPWNLAPPEWVPDPRLDLDYHVRVLAVPEPGGLPEVLAEVSPLYATPLDRNRPLWEAYLVEGLMAGRGAIFVKMHHCVTDGVGGTRLLEALCGETHGASAAPPPAAAIPRATDPGSLLWRAAVDSLGEAATAARSVAGAVGAAVADPAGTLAGLAQGARMAAAFGAQVAVPRAGSPLHRARSLSRRLATLDLAAADVDAVRSRVGVTHNDVVLAILSGALHRWHTARGADVHELRALVPVNLRASEDATAGNRIGFLAASLPVGEPNPLERLRLLHARMQRFKATRGAALYPLMTRTLLVLPVGVAAWVGQQQMQRTNLVCTNVPGPRERCLFAGEGIERLYAFAPLVGDHPVAVALFSYRDTICVGLDVDPLGMPDLPCFVDALEEARAELLAVCGVDGTRAGDRPGGDGTRRDAGQPGEGS